MHPTLETTALVSQLTDTLRKLTLQHKVIDYFLLDELFEWDH